MANKNLSPAFPETGGAAPSARYYVTLTTVSTAVWTVMLGPLLVLLPDQTERMVGDAKVGVFALIAGVSGLLGIVAGPVFGRLSDRTRSRYGRRRPWIAGGGLGCALALVLTGQAGDVLSLALCWTAVQLCAVPVIAGLSATIPDRVPDHRRGAASACLGISWALAPVLGTGLAAVSSQHEVSYAVLAGFLVAGCAVFVLANPDEPLDAPAPAAAGSGGGGRWGVFWVDPRRHPDFAYAWLTRFCVALGQNMSVFLAFFFLTDVVRYEENHPGKTTEDAIAITTLIYAATVVTTAVLGGLLSDRLGRRKIFVTVATVVFAIGTAAGAFYPTWTGVLILAALTGLGFGVYEAVDMALVTEVLPNEGDRAKDLSLINAATALGVSIGPLVATPVLAIGGYPTVYLVAGLIALLGAVFVHPIRGVR